MRLSATVVFAAFALAACSDAPVGPRQSLSDAPTLQLSHLEGGSTGGDLCNGLSPCDAFDYRGDSEENRVAGICFLPPTVENHLSDPACSAPNQPGLGNLFQLTYCEVEYDHDGDGIDEPNVAPDVVPGSCLEEPKNLVEGNGHYTASFQWKKNGPNAVAPLSIFRVYVVRDGREYAHRDVIIDPNLTSPADGYVHAIGYGTEPFKLVITEDFSCVKYDTQSVNNFNAASCLISGGETVEFNSSELTGTGYESVKFTFAENSSENPFFADFEISECNTLGFPLDPADGDGEFKPLVDTPLADCQISLSSEQIETLDEPATFTVTLTDPRWDTGGEFQHARLNVLEYDELGVGALPPAENPGWLATELASSGSAPLRWLGRGLDRLASLLLPEELYAALGTGAGWNVSRMSDLQIAVMPMMESASAGSVCADGLASCTDLGGFPSGSVEEVSVYVRAPRATYDGGGSVVPNINPDPEDASKYIPVPDTRLHFFPTAESGEVRCQDLGLQNAEHRGCVPIGDLDTSTGTVWDHVVVITGDDGLAKVNWALADGPNVLNVVACGVARDGEVQIEAKGFYNEWGNLKSLEDGQDGAGPCFDRRIAMTRAADYDNGPADGFTPFEPVNTVSEVALYAPPLTFLASTCPAINVDGLKGATEWAACADSLVFTAPQQGPKVSDNAKLFWYNDGDTLFLAVEVASTNIGNRMFIQLTEAGNSVEHDGDEILVLDQLGVGTGLFQDWHNTQQCVGNNSASLCGQVDGGGDQRLAAAGAALVTNGRAFYEFKRPLGSPHSVAVPPYPKEDLAADSGDIGIRVVLTQGQGGGKGGFVFPDPQTSATKYRVISID